MGKCLNVRTVVQRWQESTLKIYVSQGVMPNGHRLPYAVGSLPSGSHDVPSQVHTSDEEDVWVAKSRWELLGRWVYFRWRLFMARRRRRVAGWARLYRAFADETKCELPPAPTIAGAPQPGAAAGPDVLGAPGEQPPQAQAAPQGRPASLRPHRGLVRRLADVVQLCASCPTLRRSSASSCCLQQ